MINLNIQRIVTVLFLLLSYSVIAQNNKVKHDKPSILFIAIDDLRPELGCYGKSIIKSPNIDRLAASGIIFNNAYANYPVCGPSRASMLSGIYPGTNRFTKWNCDQDNDLPGLISLPMHLKNNHYKTVSLGKVYNNFGDGQGSWDKEWRPPVSTTAWDYQATESIRIFEERNKERYKNTKVRNNDNLPLKGPAYENPDVPDITYHDGQIASRAIEELQEFRNSSQPFFLAVGFHKPHLPFNAPRKYWDIYNKEYIEAPLNDYFPKNAPKEAMFNFEELRAFSNIPDKEVLPDSTVKQLLHGYYACVGYVDAQVGKVLNALESLGLAENTIIVLWGDNGWFLGEHGFWCKQSNFERAAHIPLIIKVPWKKQGKKKNALVESVDIFPTLCQLAGISQPFHLQGKSLVNLINDTENSNKNEVFYRFSNAETVITNKFSYTEWINKVTGETYERMLYDRQQDPEENINIAKLSGNKEIVKELSDKLHQHIKSREIITIQK